MNFGAVLKAEISRLARKALRSDLKSTRAQVLQQRHSIATLKRELADLKRELSQFRRSAKRGLVKTPDAVNSESRPRFHAQAFKAWRERTGLSAPDIAKALGVSFWSVHNWEHGATEPRAKTIAKINVLRAMGIKEIRRKLKG
jgi:DNA-binding transcriptional regulator YiaG